MAPTFRHGKGTRVLVNQFDLSPFLDAAKFSSVRPSADTTVFQNNDMTYTPAVRDSKISLDGRFSFSTGSASTSVDRILSNYLGGSTRFVTSIALEGQSTGGWAIMQIGDQISYDVDTPTAGIISVAADIQGSSFHAGGVMLRPLAAAIATTANGAVKFAGSTATGFSTGGGVAHMHVTAASTVTTGYTIKVQHSTSGSTWADLLTCTSPALTTADGGTFTRTTVAGNVKEQLRANLSAFTGGAAKTITFAVSFARFGKARG